MQLWFQTFCKGWKGRAELCCWPLGKGRLDANTSSTIKEEWGIVTC